MMGRIIINKLMDPSTVITPDTTGVVIDNGALLLAYVGATSSIVFAGAGAAYGTWKSSQGIDRTEKQACSIQHSVGKTLHTQNNDEEHHLLAMTPTPNQNSTKFLIPVIIAGVLAIYGMIYSIVALGQINSELEVEHAYAILGGGLTVGLSCFFSGVATGKTAYAGLPSAAESSSKFMRFCLLLVFCEAIGLYGLIAALLSVA